MDDGAADKPPNDAARTEAARPSEATRLDALRRTGLLDTPPEEAFDRLTRLAAQTLRAPVSLVSLVDADRQFFKSCAGTLPAPWHAQRQTPLSHSFCRHAVATGKPFVVSDAHDHPLVKDSAAVADLGIVAYAGVPLTLSSGETLGSFCVIDHQPRQWTDHEMDVLETLAASAVREMELRALLLEREYAESELRRSNDILRAVTEGTGDAVFVKDRRGRYLMINPAAASMVGRPPDEILGHDDTHLFDPRTAARVMAHDRRVMAGGKIEAEEGTYNLAAGERTLSSFKAPYRDADGNVVGVIGIARDVTERRRAEAALEQAKEAAEAASRSKDQFLAVLSHELRTPLAPVLALAGALEKDPALPPPLREDMGLIRRNVELEVRLIEDLLDLTRVSRGKLRLELQAVDAHALLRDALRTCSPDAVADKHLRVESDLSAASSVVLADPARLQQVFWNLVNNSVKFTLEGGCVSVRTRDEAGRFVVEVSDTGVGIDAHVLPRVFEPFEQGPDSVTRQFGGLGLGLAICRTLVDAMGGTITAHSAGRGRGATFRVWLQTIARPARRTPARPARPSPREGEGKAPASLAAGAKPVRILVVDDHVDTSKVMAALLRRSGFLVRTAGTIRAAVEAVGADPVDVVISDLGLPDGSGHDLMRYLLQKHRGVKGIALTGYGTEEDIRRSHDAGFHTHLTKPADFERLLNTIRHLAQ